MKLLLAARQPIGTPIGAPSLTKPEKTLIMLYAWHRKCSPNQRKVVGLGMALEIIS